MSMLRDVHETYFFFDCKLYCKNIANNFKDFSIFSLKMFLDFFGLDTAF